MRQVLDASAILAYLRREPGHSEVSKALAHAAGNQPLLISAVNWGEIVYVLNKAIGIQETQSTTRVLDTFPIDIVPADRQTSEIAASYKSAGRLAYADSFAAALTELSNGELLTADKDFESVKKLIKIRLIR